MNRFRQDIDQFKDGKVKREITKEEYDRAYKQEESFIFESLYGVQWKEDKVIYYVLEEQQELIPDEDLKLWLEVENHKNQKSIARSLLFLRWTIGIFTVIAFIYVMHNI